MYRRRSNLEEVLLPYLFPTKTKNNESCITLCKTCDICKNYLITDHKFECKVTGRFYNVKGNLSCNSSNVIYAISCQNSDDQYIGSATDFMAIFRILKSDIKTKKDRCGTARHFNNKCSVVQNPHRFLQVQLIESVVSHLDLKMSFGKRRNTDNVGFY